MSRKQEILSIARGVIYSKGYQATSISDILHAANIGKGQFYHYFSSKYDLGLTVVEDIIQEWEKQLIIDIFQSTIEPASKLSKMLDKILNFHTEIEKKSGCPIGNLAIEMSEHDETFRIKIQYIFERWIEAVEATLDEMISRGQLDATVDTKKSAQAMIAMIEGGILLMKNQQNIHFLINVIDVIRNQYKLA
ncbi:TetR/AcrR family transcriptional regulator [Lysinibacillus yapensis]|uniref:TetR/AcrR family transcriptional regulator n=1 Tax=Ureibacillus yapensis TaxID=2304605 RepID=A0A396S5V5_9BACL|nr:TetR/AcrR family transcriptional regulator [Lysinibacillus yapensis]RHW35877.1 TetR/AcrR family transcriptional regulator [Lysinibacillus yapensis]